MSFADDLKATENADGAKTIMFVKSGKQVVKVGFKAIFFIKGEKAYVSLHFIFSHSIVGDE